MNEIRLYPSDQNQILLVDANTILLVESPTALPNGWQANSGSTVIGGNDSGKTSGGSDVKGF